jgi:hypothetical protein
MPLRDSRFHGAGADPLSRPVALTIVRHNALVIRDSGREFLHGFEVRVELSDRCPPGLRIPDDLAYWRLVVRLQPALERSGKGSHGGQWDVVPVNPL